jgi:hypothetical protein
MGVSLRESSEIDAIEAAKLSQGILAEHGAAMNEEAAR